MTYITLWLSVVQHGFLPPAHALGHIPAERALSLPRTAQLTQSRLDAAPVEDLDGRQVFVWETKHD